MSQSSYIRPINNDRMATLMAFRHPAQERSRTHAALPGGVQQQALADSVQSSFAAGAAAPALQSAPPRPTQLSDAQAEAALGEVQQQAENMMQAHGSLDAARVARLLGLLE